MMKTRPIAVFDLDDTIIPSSRIYTAALAKLAEVSDSEFQHARTKVKDFLPPNHVAARNRLLYFKSFSENIGQFNPHKVLALQKSYEDVLFTEIQNFWCCSGRDDLFEELALKYDIYILTNENLRTQLIKLSALGDRFAECIRGMLTSEEAGYEKPQGEIFRKFISRYKLEDRAPKAITMIGDNYEHDILPAINLGWGAIQSLEFNDVPQLVWNSEDFQKLSTLNDIVQVLLDRTEK